MEKLSVVNVEEVIECMKENDWSLYKATSELGKTGVLLQKKKGYVKIDTAQARDYIMRIIKSREYKYEVFKQPITKSELNREGFVNLIKGMVETIVDEKLSKLNLKPKQQKLKTFFCDECHKSFEHLGNLNQHYRKTHDPYTRDKVLEHMKEMRAKNPRFSNRSE